MMMTVATSERAPGEGVWSQINYNMGFDLGLLFQGVAGVQVFRNPPH